MARQMDLLHHEGNKAADVSSQLNQKRQLEYEQAEFILSNIAAQDIDLH